jgi:uncharacterized protein (TIGR02466 family)
MFNINSIFPTAVLVGSIDREITKEELEVVDYHKTRVYENQGNSTSLDTHILNTQLPEIRKFIESGIKLYVDSVICPKDQLDFKITQSWINYTKPGQYHHKHYHPNSIISGVFYFSADYEKDSINFLKEEYKQIFIQSKDWNMHNAQTCTISVKTGDLVIFPSNLPHMVDPTNGEETRVSLSFNVFPYGVLGEEISLNMLRL